MSINLKLLIIIISTSIVIFGISNGFIWNQTKKLANTHIENITGKIISNKAQEIESDIDKQIVAINTFAQAIKNISNSPDLYGAQIDILLRSFLQQNSQIINLFISKKVSYIDTLGHENQFSYSVAYQQANATIIRNNESQNFKSKPWFNAISNRNTCIIAEPDWELFTTTGINRQLSTLVALSLNDDNGNDGYAVFELSLLALQQLIENLDVDGRTMAIILSNKSKIIAHPNQKYLMQQLSSVSPDFDSEFRITDLVKQGVSSVLFGKVAGKGKVVFALKPINLPGANMKWTLAMVFPAKALLKEAKVMQWKFLVVYILGILLLGIVIYFIAKVISLSVVKTTTILKHLSEGNTKGIEKLTINSGDELEEMANSVNLLMDGLVKTADFASEIGKGKLDIEYHPLSDNDELGNALIDMRKSLVYADEEENNRKIEDKKQNWATQGIAKFGEVLRNSNNIKQLSYDIVSNLINYLDASQGALFVIDNADPENVVFELQAAIAFDRNKLINKRVPMGQELVGRCGYEKKTICLTDIPENYFQITSGMGTANPTTLLLVPLILNDEIFGVIELASFKIFENYQIEFIEKVGESIASTISNVKVNEITSRLLEQSRIQAEELSAQEEEMRQNMEELQATQEEALRREMEMTAMINALSSSAFIVEYNMEGVIISINEKYAQLLGMPSEQIVGKKHSEGYEFSAEVRANYEAFWNDLRNGKEQKITNKVTFNGNDLWLEENYVPIRHVDDHMIYKILKISFDISEHKIKEAKILAQNSEIEKESELINEYKAQITALNNQADELQRLKEKNAAYEAEIEVLRNKPTAPVEVASVEMEEEILPIEEIDISSDELDWNNNMVIGITELDQQHEQLVALLNQINQSFINNKTKKEIKDNIRGFVDFTAYHFGTEEAYFEQFNYTQAPQHIDEHKAFVKELHKLQKDFAANKIKNTDEFMRYLNNWVYKHITQLDSQYALSFKEQGLS